MATLAQISSKVDTVRLQTLVIGILTTFFAVLLSPVKWLFLEGLNALLYILRSVHAYGTWAPGWHTTVMSGIHHAIALWRANVSAWIHDVVHGTYHSPLLYVYKASLTVAIGVGEHNLDEQ
jgi:hypothetical protein